MSSKRLSIYHDEMLAILQQLCDTRFVTGSRLVCRVRFPWRDRAFNRDPNRIGLISVGIGAEDFDEIALFAEVFDGSRDFPIFLMAIAVDEEEVFPGFPFART